MTQPELAQAQILVLFATFNGATTLPAMLSAYEKLEAPQSSWAMVVVDNASTDETPQILAKYAQSLPMVVLRESKPGKNVALNRALEAAGRAAELYIFTDDDAIPDPDFLKQWERVLEERPDNELFGAVVDPYFPKDTPEWLWKYRPHFAELYAAIDLPEGEMRAEDIYGPNMAVRGSIIARGAAFNEDIGPNAGQSDYPMGSENEFCQRVARDSDQKPWFAPGPRVRHIVRPFQMTKEFVGGRAYRHGRGTAMRQALFRPHDLALRTSLRTHLFTAFAGLAGRANIGLFWWHYHWSKGYRSWIREAKPQTK